MNLLADESADKPIVERLRPDGHDVLYVAEMEPGIADELVLQRANAHQSLLEKIAINLILGDYLSWA